MDQSTPAKKKNINFQPSSGQQTPYQTQTQFKQDSTHLPKKRLRDLPGPFGKYLIVNMDGERDHATLSRFVSRNGLQYSCEITPLPKNLFKSVITLGGHYLCEAVAMTAKEARVLAVSCGLQKLKQQCYTVLYKGRLVGQDVNQSDLNPESKTPQEQTEGNNIGGKLMKMMGWTGGGLGKDSQGIVEPIQAATTVRRGGLGVPVTMTGRKFETAVRQYIQNWLQDGARQDLVFSNDFSKEDRKIVHKIAASLGAKSKSYGTNAERRLVVSGKTLENIVEELLDCGGDNGRCQLLEPEEVK